MHSKKNFLKLRSLVAIFTLFILVACSPCPCDSGESSLTEVSDSVIYNEAIQYAMYPEEFKVYDSLVPITKENPDLIWKMFDGEEYVLMVSWKGYIDPYVPYKDTGYFTTPAEWPIWVTAAPQLQQCMKKEKYDDAYLRLKQLIGLPPDSSNKYTDFVEFWVKPADLFRPCPDNEITDTKCDVCFPKDADSTFKVWIDSMRISRYYPCGLLNKYPWTSLGYTFDWDPKNKSHVGLSEFVIRNNVKVKIAGIIPTDDYLKQ